MAEVETVLLTGASSGIGATTAALLARRGLRVYGTSRRPPEGGRPDRPDARGIRWLALDVRDDASVSAALDSFHAHETHLDGLVCNAGVGIFGSVEETTIEAAQRQFETNYFGVLRMLRAALPGMRKRGFGRVVLIGSLSGRAPIPFQSHYSSTKAAVDALAGALRNEVSAHGIEVTLVEPGDVNTPFNDATDWSVVESSAYAERIETCAHTIRELLPKAASPDVVAHAVLGALRARRPRHRHAVGDDSIGAPFGKRALPDRVFLDIIRRHFGL